MNMAARPASLPELAQKRAGGPRVARVEVFSSLEKVRPFWLALQCPAQFSTPFQSFEFLSTWQRTVGDAMGQSMQVVVGFDESDAPVVLLPLIVRRRFGFFVAEFAGGKHVTFNMALWRREFAQSATLKDLRHFCTLLHAALPQLDALSLLQQPRSWHGLQNPFSLLPRQKAINDCPRQTIPPNAAGGSLISSGLRRRLKGKERKLQVLPGYRYTIARDSADAKRLMDAFFVFKPQHMAAQKLPNVFADPGVEDFARQLCDLARPDGKRLVDLHALECDSEVIAIFAGVADGERYSMMFNTYTMSANARYSPGLILIRHIVEHYAAKSYRAIDLGIGAADYKTMFCKEQEPLFDAIIPLNAKGYVAAAGISTLQHAKRMVKQHPWLVKAIRSICCRNR